MSEELNKTEASMPFLTLEPQLEPEAPAQPGKSCRSYGGDSGYGSGTERKWPGWN